MMSPSTGSAGTTDKVYFTGTKKLPFSRIGKSKPPMFWPPQIFGCLNAKTMKGTCISLNFASLLA